MPPNGTPTLLLELPFAHRRPETHGATQDHLAAAKQVGASRAAGA